MRSSNPVFSRRGFSRDNGSAGFHAAPQAGGAAVGTVPAPVAGNPYANNPYAQADVQYGVPQAPPTADRMTMDDVVTRTAGTLGTLIVFAALAWTLLPVDEANIGKSYGYAIGAGLVAMVLALVQSFKRKASPALILTYAALEGVFLGVLSSAVDARVDGAAMQAVIGTMATFTAVLVAYKTGVIRVNRRFVGFVMAAAMGFVLLMAVNLLFAAFGGGDGLGFRSGGLGILFGIIGIVLGALFLALDFKQVEDGIRYGAPKQESWLAAFGLTLTLVWIYMEFLRLIAILQGND
ncbi:Bax inhibitor-1/YccA family protein [Streptomyces sp. P6-2-1]|uniref:Bax inhibitor-1/YccA family protein n=1 Tax=unclassified Streptomyces TaxID=2593676 RepID=UPI003D361816